jgi:recombinational DNA repair ATPase RecF
MSGVIDQIREWASELEYWEQAALEKIARGDVLREDDFRDLLNDCMMDAGLVETQARPGLSFPIRAAIATPQPKVRLERLFNLKNVNALPEGQEIRFGPQLTLVFGDNGAGKTGYARPLGCAAFGRGERDVLPNATRISEEVPEAEIEIFDGATTRTLMWKRGLQNAELTSFYVFDGASLSIHLTRSNPLSLAPSGLTLLTALAEVTDEVRERLRRLIDSRDVDHNFGTLFEGDSLVNRTIQCLSAETDLDSLKKVSGLTEEERALVERVQTEIAELKSRDIAKLLDKRRREISDLNSLVQAISRAESALDQLVVIEATKLLSELRSREEEIERSGVEQFKFDAFTQVGSDAWREFVVAAKALADGEAIRGAPYPQIDDHCLLCRQPLPRDAVAIINKMWSFLSSDAQARLEAARNACDSKIAELQKVGLGYFAPDSGARRLLESDLPTIVPMIESQVSACSSRQNELIQALRTRRELEISRPIPVDIAEIQQIIGILEREIKSLEENDANEQLANLELTLRELKHRQLLGSHFSAIETYVLGKRWVGKARKSLGSTRSITTKYNEMFKQLVTDKYATLFETTLNRFKSGMRVKIETRGQKGETVRQIALDPAAYPKRFPVERILSDGQKTAVALADFLTEASLDESSSGIILDDPITSLDSNWKEVLADCLTEYAKHRQVIVFTHDLPFLYRLTASAEKLGVSVMAHWIREENGKPGFVYPNNSPVCEQDYKSTKVAQDCYSKAKRAEPAEQQLWLQQGFGALRTTYEALVIFELFNGVVARFEERISFDRLTGICIEREVVKEVVERMGILSRYIAAHLHSDSMAATKPSPDVLHEEIEIFENLKKRVKNSKKQSQVEMASPVRTTTVARAPDDSPA